MFEIEPAAMLNILVLEGRALVREGLVQTLRQSDPGGYGL